MAHIDIPGPPSYQGRTMTGTGTAGLASDHDRPGNRSFKLGDETRTVPRDAPGRPSSTNSRHQEQPANMQEPRAFGGRATHGKALVMTASLGGLVACPIGKGAGRSGSDHLVDAEIKGW